MNVLASLVTMALVTGQAPAAKPDFTGKWTMNAARSNFGGLPPPSVLTRTISHAEPTLYIAERQVSELGEQNTTRTYNTNGTGTVFQSAGAEVKSSAVWNGNTLVVVSTVDVVGLTYNDVMALSEDRKTLTSTLHIESPQGGVDIVVVFDRQ
jgi:hypothetical protein